MQIALEAEVSVGAALYKQALKTWRDAAFD